MVLANPIHGAPRTDRLDCAFVTMPFGPLSQPSIGLSLIRASLPDGIRSRIFYATIRFAELIGARWYDLIAEGFPNTTDLAGEWIFRGCLTADEPARVEQYVREVLASSSGWACASDDAPSFEHFVERLREIRALAPTFVEHCADDVLSDRPRIVAFTSVFQQNVASIALARRIKLRAPDTVVVFGGANCEGSMGAELVCQYPWIDAAVSGEGEIAFPAIVKNVLTHGRVPDDMQGVATPANGRRLVAAPQNAPAYRNLDDLPRVEYSDFVDQFSTSSLARERSATLLFETSRGCWWGERNHCTFCGLNGTSMAYRAKSAQRALDELLDMTARYAASGITRVAAVDNILSMGYFRDFLPALAARDSGVELFYEVKANLRKEQLRLMRKAGIVSIQPGIESLSTTVLTLMRKGVRAIQNVQLLKWCKELRITASWNILFGFPGEQPADYAAMAAAIPALMHLRPPVGAAKIRLDRFSPNFDDAERVGLRDVRPYPAYSYVYDGDEQSFANLAYFFTYRYADGRDVDSYTAQLVPLVARWKAEYESSEFMWIDEGGVLRLIDTRPSAVSPVAGLRGLARAVMLLCDSARSFDEISEHVTRQFPDRRVDGDELRAALAALEKRNYLFREGNLYLSLAIEQGTYPLSSVSVKRFSERVAAARMPRDLSAVG